MPRVAAWKQVANEIAEAVNDCQRSSIQDAKDYAERIQQRLQEAGFKLVRGTRRTRPVSKTSPVSKQKAPAKGRRGMARYFYDARTKRGLSVAEVADSVGVSSSSIYFWETDHCRPRDRNLSALCKVLKLPIRVTRERLAAAPLVRRQPQTPTLRLIGRE